MYTLYTYLNPISKLYALDTTFPTPYLAALHIIIFIILNIKAIIRLYYTDIILFGINHYDILNDA